jgi:hypothetical protein
VRLHNGEYKRSAGELKRFVMECADHLYHDELVVVKAAMVQRQDINNLLIFMTPPAPLDAVSEKEGGSAPKPDKEDGKDGKLRNPSFEDFDGRGMFVDSSNSAVITAASLAYNADSPRWRLLGDDPLRSLAKGAITTTLAPFSFNSELLRNFLLSQNSVFKEEKHDLFKVPSPYLNSATDHLLSQGWLHDPLLFKGLAGAHFDSQGRSNEVLLHPGHFLPGKTREVALLSYMEELDTGLTSGQEIIRNLVVCLTGVFFAPDLLLEYKRLDVENKFSENSPRCSQEVLIGQFHRELQRSISLLRQDMRSNGQETAVGSGVLLQKVFSERGAGVAKWLMERLGKSLDISTASSLPQARDLAIKFLRSLAGGDGGRAPSPAPFAARSASPIPPGHVSTATPSAAGHAPRPCVYSFLGQFCPNLGLKCVVGEACSFSHSFGDQAGKALKAVRSVLDGVPHTSNLGSRRPEIVRALDALAL